MTDGRRDENANGRRAALVIAGTAVFWVAAIFVGGQMGLDNRTLALFDLIALAGFIYALWMVFNIWRARRDKQGPDGRTPNNRG